MLWQIHYPSGKESLWSIHHKQLPSREQFCQWEGVFMPLHTPLSRCPFDQILFWYFGEYFSCTLPDWCLSDSIINKDTLLHQSYSVPQDFLMVLIQNLFGLSILFHQSITYCRSDLRFVCSYTTIHDLVQTPNFLNFCKGCRTDIWRCIYIQYHQSGGKKKKASFLLLFLL